MISNLTAINLALEEASNDISKSRFRLQNDAPELLFHYTNSLGLRGILDSSMLWATHYRFLNDTSEVVYSIRVFEDLINERRANVQDAVISSFLNVALGISNMLDGMLDGYIACFCERDDLLSQWRTYAESGGGYALGFKTNRIGRPGGHQGNGQEFVLRRVIYDLEEQRCLLSDVIDKTIQILVNHTRGISPSEERECIIICRQFLFSEVIDYLLSFKHPAFAIEQEWRLCHLTWRDQERHVLFRDGQFGLTPYVRLDISPKAGVHYDQLPLARITHGPVPNPDNVAFALRKLLNLRNYSSVDITGSILPVRVAT